MSKKPVLVIMAAGMGSRYGGLKQIDPVDPYGNMIIDFSIYDAKQAGFEKVIFIIKKAIDEAFREGIGKRIEKYMDVEYVYQELDVLPKGYEVPEGRVKPWLLIRPNPASSWNISRKAASNRGEPVMRFSVRQKPSTAHRSPSSIPMIIMEERHSRRSTAS